MNTKLLDFAGKELGEKELPKVFVVEKVNESLIWEVIKAENASMRQGTHKTKEKGEIRGGGAKPFRQKGTGRARQGSNRSPLMRGGGTVFGPRPRDYSEKIPVSKKKAGIRHIIAKKALEGKIVVIESWKPEKINAKTAFEGFDKVVKASSFNEEYFKGKKVKANTNDNRRKITVLVEGDVVERKKSVRNIPWINLININRMAALPLFYNHGIIITSEAFDKLESAVRAK
ncbi:MAG: 50S ribosomal protein L4 [Spirochaetia bacterium]|nr:50S ribosomal protein L4 [Spirochaetia bacterium]